MASLSLRELVANRELITTEIDVLKSSLSDIDKQIAALANPEMTARLEAVKKDSGSLKLSVDGIQIQGEIRKTIKWDSDKLKVIAAKLPAEDSAVIFTVELSVTQEQLDALEECEHPALGEILCARTVKLSPFTAKPIKSK